MQGPRKEPQRGVTTSHPAQSTPATQRPFVYKVPSQILLQASPVFKSALTGPWKEGSGDEGGIHQVTTEDWDVEAFHIVLAVVHGRNKYVPRTVIVDYYQIHEALQSCAETWIRPVNHSLPMAYGRDALLWVFISFVFRDETVFQETTRLFADAVARSPDSRECKPRQHSTEPGILTTNHLPAFSSVSPLPL
jgi:hypothetical protein